MIELNYLCGSVEQDCQTMYIPENLFEFSPTLILQRVSIKVDIREMYMCSNRIVRYCQEVRIV